MKILGKFLSKDVVSGKMFSGSETRNWLSYLPFFLMFLGLCIITGTFAIDLIGIGSQTGYGARQFMLALGGFSLLMSGVILITSGKPRQASEWILLIIVAVGVAIASDLVVESGLPKFGVRQLLIFPIVLSLMVLSAVITLEQRSQDTPLNSGVLEWKNGVKILSVFIQLGLLMIVVNQYDLENRAFSQNILPLVLYGFLIHSILPMRLRLPFFLLLSVVALFGIFGFSNGLWLLSIGVLLIGISHLPVPFWGRVGLLGTVGTALALLRADKFVYPWSGAIWPILGSMFMFRLIIYMYDLKHRKEPFSPVSTLSYFFMLPNLVFPLFPVVDYGNFRRTYYDNDHHVIYQKGADWILRGVVQLIVYRFVSYYLVLSPQDVLNTFDLIRYILSTFLLYLRVSGQFHIIVGILHLFGFNLPETHHLYYLASSFTDFWRRINIYWKDFMLKIFYYPVFFQLRNLGPTPALVISTLVVFFVTWFFHAYQWFWLRGSFLLTWTDTLFWAILAVLVVINSLYEAKYGKKRTLKKQVWTLGHFTSLALRTAGTFITIAILWTLWSSTSLAEFFTLWSLKDSSLTGITVLIIILLFVGLIVGGIFWNAVNNKFTWFGSLAKRSFSRSVMVTGFSALLIYSISTPMIYTHFGGRVQELIRDMKVARLNDRDAALLQRGYYEDLIGVNRFNSQLWEVYMSRPGDVKALNEEVVTQTTNDFLKQELRPLVATVHFENIPFRTNRWGMRDRDYEKTPNPGTYRIAVLGASSVMGWGVSDNETFESLLEVRLNQDTKKETNNNYELLNFGVSGYSPFQELMFLEKKAFEFEPDAIFYMAHQYDEEVAIQHLGERVRAGVDIPYDYLNGIVHKLGIDQSTPEAVATKRLTPFGEEMISWTYHQIVKDCLQRGVLPVWIFMPTPELYLPEENIATLKRLASEAGFTVLDLEDVYSNEQVESLWVADWDHHPNALAHKLFSNRLYETLLEHPEILSTNQ